MFSEFASDEVWCIRMRIAEFANQLHQDKKYADQ